MIRVVRRIRSALNSKRRVTYDTFLTYTQEVSLSAIGAG